jgi:class 3 adenylate cyclase
LDGSGPHSSPEPYRGGVHVERTFAIVDMAGFTAAVDVHGDLTAADLAGQLVTATNASLGPRDELVKSMGDAVLVVCPDPSSGLAFVQRAFGYLDGDAAPLPLLRAGIHHGSAEQRGGDYFGAAVNVAARVADLAGACQILATTEVATAARAASTDVTDLGDFELRNIVDPVRLYEIDCGLDARGHTIDPVCRMRIPRDHAAGQLRHAGIEYSFCSLHCVARFATNPTLYTS